MPRATSQDSPVLTGRRNGRGHSKWKDLRQVAIKRVSLRPVPRPRPRLDVGLLYYSDLVRSVSNPIVVDLARALSLEVMISAEGFGRIRTALRAAQQVIATDGILPHGLPSERRSSRDGETVQVREKAHDCLRGRQAESSIRVYEGEPTTTKTSETPPQAR